MMLEVTARTIKRTSYPAYKDSGVEWLGDVPAHWEVKRGRFCADVNPQSLSSLHPDIEVSFVPMEAVGEYGGLDLDQTRSVFEVGSGYTEFKDGDVIVAKITPCFENGKGALAMGLLNGIGFGTTELHVLRPFENLDVRFLFYFSISQVFRSMGEGEMYGAGGQKRVPPEFCKDIQIPLPPIEEQNSISDFLDHQTEKIDTLVTKKRTLIERLKEERTALITHTVTRGLPPEAARAAGLELHPNFKPSGVEWLGDVPTHWEVKNLKWAVMLQRGHDLPAEEREEGLVPLVSSSGISASHSQSAAKGPGIVTGRYGTIGKFYLVEKDYWPLNTTLYSVDLRGNDPRFLQALLTHLSPLFLLNAVKSAVPGVDRNDIHPVASAVPPVPEQRAIAAFLDRETEKIDTLVTKIETAIERLQEYRSALITAAVTGKIDVTEDRKKELTSKSLENTEGGKFLTSIDKKKADILNSARDKNFYDEDFLKDYNILNFYENVSNFVGLRSLFPNSFYEDGVDLQNLKKEYREWMQLNETKELFERSIRYERGRHFKKYVEAAKKNLSSKCLEPNCQKKAIGSHLISQKYLKFISCKDNKVREIGLFTDPKKMADSFESKMRKNPFILIEHILNPKSNHFKEIKKSSEKFGTANRQGRSSRLTPIHYASQFYGYCSKHDSEIYKYFENNDFDPNNRQHLNLIVKRTFDYLYRHIDETCKLRPQELLDAVKNDDNYYRYIKSIFATRQAFDNPENMRDDFFHLTYIVKSEKPPVIACSRDLSLHGSLIREASKGNNIEKSILNLYGSMFLNIFPIKETETLVCLSFLNGLYFRLFIDQSKKDIVIEDLCNAILSDEEKRINKEISKLILDRTDTLYLREEFYQTLMRKGFKENLSDFMPTDELNFLNY